MQRVVEFLNYINTHIGQGGHICFGVNRGNGNTNILSFPICHQNLEPVSQKRFLGLATLGLLELHVTPGAYATPHAKKASWGWTTGLPGAIRISPPHVTRQMLISYSGKHEPHNVLWAAFAGLLFEHDVQLRMIEIEYPTFEYYLAARNALFKDQTDTHPLAGYPSDLGQYLTYINLPQINATSSYADITYQIVYNMDRKMADQQSLTIHVAVKDPFGFAMELYELISLANRKENPLLKGFLYQSKDNVSLGTTHSKYEVWVRCPDSQFRLTVRTMAYE